MTLNKAREKLKRFAIWLKRYPTMRFLGKDAENTDFAIDGVIFQTFTDVKGKPIKLVKQGKKDYESYYLVIPAEASELRTKKISFLKRAISYDKKGFFGGLAQQLLIVGFSNEEVES